MIIHNSAVWRAGQVIELDEIVQIAPGAKLTIEAGAVVRGGTIQVFGALDVKGAPSQSVSFDSTTLLFGSNHATPGRVDIKFAEWTGGAFLPATGNGSYGSFSVEDSKFVSTDGFYIWYPTADSDFSRNLFQNTATLSIGTDHQMTLSANSFVNSANGAIEIWAAYGPPVQIYHNTFTISQGKVAIELPQGYTSSAAFADSNYWGTTDPSIINRFVLDARDDLERASVISVAKPLLAPHPDAPTVPLFVRGSNGNDILVGGTVDDTIIGGKGNDRLSGMDGDDYLDGGTGADRMEGALGNDKYVVNDTGDRVVEASNGGTDTVYAGVTHALSRNVENLVLAGSDALVGKGNSLANLITGNIGDNRLYGAAGNDTLNGGAGNDNVNGGVGDDSVSDSSGNDALFGFDGNDWVSGGSGNDLLNGGSGKDTLLGGSGADKMDGGLGSDHLDGGTGNDKLLGGDGGDTLSGGVGRDTIDGGTGKDALTGGKSADVFLFRTASDSTPGRYRDVITDFTRGDKIDLSGIDANIRARGNQDFDFDGTTADANSVWYVRTGDKVVLRADTNGDTRADFEVALTGITRLIESDFIF